MRFYRGKTGWETAADRAGKDAELVNVPETKQELLAWLNANLPIQPPPPEPDLLTAPAEPAVITNSPKDRCPNCGSARREAQQLATAYFDQLTAAAVADKVLEFDGHKLANVLAAALDRLRELEKRAKALPPEPAPQQEPAHEPA